MNNRDAISLEATREILFEPRIYGLAESLQAAVKTWRTQYHSPAPQPATRASIITDHFYWNVSIQSLAAQPGMTIGAVKGPAVSLLRQARSSTLQVRAQGS